MANNTSTSVDVGTLIGAFGYLVEGLVFGICNVLISLSVLKYTALRQLNQYVMLMILAFADAGNLFGYFFAGAYRLWLIHTDQLSMLVTPVECLLKPQTLLLYTAHPFSSFMLVILSLDRLAMVSFPSFYILSLPSPIYAYVFVLSGLAVSCLMALPAVIHICLLPNEPIQFASCYARDAMKMGREPFGDIFNYYYQRLAYLAFLSVVIFAAVPLVHTFRGENLGGVQQQNQHRMTKTVAVSCTCTLFLFCIPNRLGYIAWDAGRTIVSWLLFLFTLTNPAANILIYTLRHSEMRLALKGLLKCKIMPETLWLWPKPYGHGQAFRKPAQVVPMAGPQPPDLLQVENV